MKILAIGAHPDDIEIFMAGFLFACKKLNHEIDVMIATNGALGGKKISNLTKKRYQETKKALVEINNPIFLDLPDGYLGYDDKHQFILKKNIENIKPDLVVTHDINDYHSDHQMLSKMVSIAVSHYIPVMYCDTLMGLNFNPDYYVDITKYFKLKVKAILEHESQNPQRFVELAKMMNSYRAAQCNAPIGHFAECYKFRASFPFGDIRELLPKPPKLRPFYIESVKGFL